ncbi:MAG: hypothetical protein GC204_10985 [Chloroflexi bacterium]|nr:hypothetical protein [Chloroflexota bacterium]
MPLSTTWYDEAKTIVRIEFQDPWNMTELSQAIQASRELMESVSYTVDAIWDGTGTKGGPSNILSHFMMPNEDTKIPTNQGVVVVVVRGAFLQTFVSLAKRLLPQITRQMHITNSLQAAGEKIALLRQNTSA